MESPEISYLYTIALLGISFMGFAAIVMLLREALGGHLGPFDVLFARVYMEGALIVSMGAMLPPLLMFWALSTGAVWRLCSGLVGVPLLGIALSYPARRRATTGKSTPRYVRVNTTIVLLISLTLLIDATGLLHERSASGIPGCPDRISDFFAGGLAPSAEHYPCAGGETEMTGRKSKADNKILRSETRMEFL